MKILNDFSHNPKLLLGFFCLVALMTVAFGQYGESGIITGVILSVGIIIVASIVANSVKKQMKQIRDGKENKLSFLLESGPRPKNKTIIRPNAYALAQKQSRYSISEIEEEERHTEKLTRAVAVRPPQDITRAQYLNAVLELATDFNPGHDEVIGRGITCIGMRGSGKSELAALLLEQIWKLPVIPGVCFDYKVDYASLEQVLPNVRIGGAPHWEDAELYPKKYWAVTVENAKAIGYEIRERCAQLVIQLSSYKSMDEQAQVMSGVIAGMFAWARDHRQNPVPALVALDEAQQYLPQNAADTSISKPLLQELFRAFKQLNEVGRSYGLQPLFFTQRAARINKDVIGGSEIWILMKQTMPQDLAACDQLLGEKVDRAMITGFKAGEAIVYEGGSSFTVRFDRRQSKHLNKTPTLKDAMKQYQRVSVPERFTVTLPDEDEYEDDYEDEGYEEEYVNESKEVIQRVLRPIEQRVVAPAVRPAPAKKRTELEVVVDFFRENPMASSREAEKVLYAIGKKDKIGSLRKEAIERGLLPGLVD